MNALLDAKSPLKGQFEKKADFFRAAAKDRAAQGALLAAFELFLSDEAAEQVKTLAVVLQVMYDKDIAEEETLVRGRAAGPGRVARPAGVDYCLGPAVCPVSAPERFH